MVNSSFGVDYFQIEKTACNQATGTWQKGLMMMLTGFIRWIRESEICCLTSHLIRIRLRVYFYYTSVKHGTAGFGGLVCLPVMWCDLRLPTCLCLRLWLGSLVDFVVFLLCRHPLMRAMWNISADPRIDLHGKRDGRLFWWWGVLHFFRINQELIHPPMKMQMLLCLCTYLSILRRLFYATRISSQQKQFFPPFALLPSRHSHIL